MIGRSKVKMIQLMHSLKVRQEVQVVLVITCFYCSFCTIFVDIKNVTSQLILHGHMITLNNVSPHFSFKRRSVYELYTTATGKDLNIYIHILAQSILSIG